MIPLLSNGDSTQMSCLHTSRPRAHTFGPQNAVNTSGPQSEVKHPGQKARLKHPSQSSQVTPSGPLSRVDTSLATTPG